MIILVHLYNDRSGSPKVLSLVANVLQEAGYDPRLYVGKHGKGSLDDLSITIERYSYRRYSSKILTLFSYLWSQFHLFLMLLLSRQIPKDAIVYVNTLMPFGAAVYGKLTGRKVIYHLHEISISPRPFLRFLLFFAKKTANQLIYVSEYHFDKLPVDKERSHVLYNVLDKDFEELGKAHNYRHKANGVFKILMLASLRDFKGVPELISLAECLTLHKDIQFHLVANDDDHEIRSYFSDKERPANLIVHPRSKNTAEHYQGSSLVLNLSRPDQWIETFGMTILEAMCFGIPVIGPPIGGPTEILIDGEQGFTLDSRQGEELIKKVHTLYENEALCLDMSVAAKKRSHEFSRTRFKEHLCSIISGA